MRVRLLLIFTAATAAQAWAGPLQVVGYSGSLGEWEWSASVTEKIAGRTKEFSGPLTLQHVGVCTQEGPETKTGQIRFQLSKLPSEMKATIWIDGVECTFSGRLSDRYSGSMTCPDRQAMPLNIWLK
ncbi:hypothetical protein QTI24_12550 [Variovorax sp. J22P240]|uniref:hypothetical protein n=1 Tax=Variovorax sp. J22P240 TaxID=3053514 RepID=UPI0025785AB7|nr:hypothetical protein [Variovorax sp. J22P240]MDL9999441.1 hypothetical protein [Variovorax sp. J22P240]